MKLNHIFLPFAALCAVVASCSEKPEHNGNGGEEQPDIEVIPLAPTIPSDISSIYELDGGTTIVNSHSDVWKNTALELDSSRHVNLRDLNVDWDASAMYRTALHKLSDGRLMLAWASIENGKASVNTASGNADLRKWQYNGKILEMNIYYQPSRIAITDMDGGKILLAVAEPHGIYTTISSDNGNSWSTVNKAFTADEWHSIGEGLSAVSTEDGTVQIYYSLVDINKVSTSGYLNETVRLLTSSDGVNWADAGAVAGESVGTDTDGNVIYTDGAPSAVMLNSGRGVAIATTAEKNGHFISFAYDRNGKWETPVTPGATRFPMDRNDCLFSDMHFPLLAKFPSGETLLAMLSGSDVTIRTGNSIARNFEVGPETSIKADRLDFNGAVIGPRTFALTYGSIIAEYILNHKINATAFTPAVDGNNEDWKDVTESFFIGSNTGAQLSIRFGYSDDWLFVLAERLDGEILEGDVVEFMFQGGDGTGEPLTIRLTPDLENGVLVCENKAVGLRSNINKGLEGKRDGYIAEFGIHRSLLRPVNGRILFNAVMTNDGKEDSFTGLTRTNCTKWLPVDLKEFTQPEPEPEPNISETFNEGPSWSTGSTVNPW